MFLKSLVTLIDRNGWKAAVDSFGACAPNVAMRDETIAEVTMDEAGRLLLKPAETLFDTLHMAGAWGFRWDEPTGSLAIPLPKEWSYCDWFSHVVTIIGQEYDVHLTVGPQTKWISVPEAVRAELLALNA